MKKILGFILLLCLFAVFLVLNITEAKRYEGYSTSYSATGVKTCNSDGDVGDSLCATVSTVSIAGTTTCPGNVNLASNSGTMKCWYWDSLAPTGTVVYSPSGWTKGNVTVSITCSDTGRSGCNMYAISGWTISGSKYMKTFTANTTGSIVLKDKAGNSRTVIYNVGNIDNTVPTGTVVYSPSGPTNGNVTVSITCADADSGCNMYAISGWTISGSKYMKTFTGNTTGSIVLKDNVGNTKTVTYDVGNIDKTVPTGTVVYSPSGWTNGNVIVSITCADADSGCNMYAISGWTISGSKYMKTFITNTAGSIALKDVAGNTKTISYNVSKIDKTPPVLSATPIGGGWINNSTLVLNVSDVGSGIGLARYRWNNSDCWNGTNFTDGISIPTIEGTNTLYLCSRDLVGNSSTWNGVYKIDTNPPDIGDFTVKVGGVTPGENLLAANNSEILFTYTDTGGSAVTINYNIEKASNYFSFDSFSKTYPTSGLAWDMHSVDNDRNLDGNREYTMKLTLCDEAGNCTSEQNYKWYVYANTPVSYETSNFTDLSNIKVGNFDDYFVAGIRLEDQFGNDIVPASGINRNITINLTYDNTVYLNQYDVVGSSGIYFKLDGDTEYTSMSIGEGQFISKIYTNNKTNGDYIFSVKSYVPTWDGDNYANGRIRIDKLVYNVSDDENLLNVNNQKVIDQYLSIKPIVSAKISGLPPLAPEGVDKDFDMELVKLGSVDYDALNVMLDYSPHGEPINTYITKQNFIDSDGILDRCLYATYGSNIINKWTTCDDWNEFSLNTGISYSFNEGFNLQEGSILDPEKIGFVSTHVRVRYNDGVYAVWNSDIVGRNNYNYNTIDQFYSTQTSVFIIGLIGVSDYDKLNQVIKGSMPEGTGTVNKSILRSQMNKSVEEYTRGIDGVYINSEVEKDIFNPLIGEYVDDKDVKVYYYHGDSNPKIVLPENVGFADKYLLIVEGGDVYISGNLLHEDDGMLGIISLRRDDKGGNIYVDSEVTNIDALMYADAALISYTGNPLVDDGSFTTQEHMSQGELSNQILIKGVVWSYNTLGASRSSTPYCPYFYPSTEICTLTDAQKYDLEYFRRFYLTKATVYDAAADSDSWIPYDSKLAGGVVCSLEDSGTDGNVDLDTKCRNDSSSLVNRLGITSGGVLYNPFGGDGKELTESQKDNASPVILEYDGRFKTEYMPIFSD